MFTFNADPEFSRRRRLKAKTSWRHIRRNVLRVSQARIASICGVSRGTVARWESPDSDKLPDVAQIGMICAALGYEASHMIGWIVGGMREI